jgi:hypothetical protein
LDNGKTRKEAKKRNIATTKKMKTDEKNEKFWGKVQNLEIPIVVGACSHAHPIRQSQKTPEHRFDSFAVEGGNEDPPLHRLAFFRRLTSGSAPTYCPQSADIPVVCPPSERLQSAV